MLVSAVSIGVVMMAAPLQGGRVTRPVAGTGCRAAASRRHLRHPISRKPNPPAVNYLRAWAAAASASCDLNPCCVPGQDGARVCAGVLSQVHAPGWGGVPARRPGYAGYGGCSRYSEVADLVVGICRVTVVPWFGSVRMCRVPAWTASRSAMLVRPVPWLMVAGL